jgi:hypothetical protein
MKTKFIYYAKSGSFSNAIIITAFNRKKDRDAFVSSAPMNGEDAQIEHNREAITRKEAEQIMTFNRQQAKDRERYGAAYSENYGTKEINEIF